MNTNILVKRKNSFIPDLFYGKNLMVRPRFAAYICGLVSFDKEGERNEK